MDAAAAGSRRTVGLAASITLASVLLVLAAVPVGAQVSNVSRVKEPTLPTAMSDVRAALDKYRDPIAAVRDGYFSTVACIDYPKGMSEGNLTVKPGAMGVHFLNTANIGPTPDPAKPPVLIYEPVGDKLRLVGAEWFVPAQLVKDSVAPRIFDQTMQGPMAGHAPIMAPELRHYDLHVWLWRENPRGLFDTTNPKVTCPKGGYSYAAGHADAGHKH